MKRTTICAVAGLLVLWLAGCEGSEPAASGASAGATPTQTSTPTPLPTHTPVPSPSPTLGPGANIGFIGLLRADNTLITPATTDAAGRPVYVRTTGSGFVLVIDAKPGTDGSPVGLSAYDYNPTDPLVEPDLQVEVSHDLGNGSAAVCDNTQGDFGGVPGIDPASFDPTQPIVNALNDLGCRFNDGTGLPQGRLADSACVLFPDGEFRFVDTSATVEFCATITHPLSFSDGDTIVTARVRDQDGIFGPARQIVIRVQGQ